jgi:DNA-binding LacI/PurR family transcriptional regulator
MANGVKLVLVNRPPVGHGSYHVTSDDRGGGAIAAERFVAAGLSRLAVVASASNVPAQAGRTDGFVERAKALGASVEVTRNGPDSYLSGRLGAAALFGDGATSVPEAVFCTTDLIAVGFMDSVRQDYGHDVPGDVSVIGFDDIPQAAWGAYRLTTLRQSTDDLALAAVRAIRNDDKSPSRAATVGVALVDRATVLGYNTEAEKILARTA